MSHLGLTLRERCWSRCAFYLGTVLVLWTVDASLPSVASSASVPAREAFGVATAYHGYPGLPPGVAPVPTRNPQ